MGKKSKLQRAIEDALIQDALTQALKPSLANPAFATHALVMFAVEHKSLFREWVNEDAGITPGDEPKTDAEIEQCLELLHGVIHAAMVASLVELPSGRTVRLVTMPRHVRPMDTPEQ